MGLLQRSLSLSNAKSLNFLDFTRKFNLKVCGIYKKEDNKYFISNSIGYDGISIISSVASADFWDGTVTEKNKLVKISERSKLLPFFQLFSFNLKDDISTLYYYSTEDSTLIICLSDDETIDEGKLVFDYLQLNKENLFELDLSKLDKDSNEDIELIKINTQTLIDNYIEENLKNKNYESLIRKALSNEISNTLGLYFQNKNLIKEIKPNVFSLLLFSKNEVSLDLLKQHLIMNLEKKIGASAKQIVMVNVGKANSINELKEFLDEN